MSEDWTKAIREMLKEVVLEYELPESSLCLSDNIGQNGEEQGIISHTLFIWEPDIIRLPNAKPEQNKIVGTIFLSKAKSRPNDIDFSIKEGQENAVHEFLPIDAEIIDQTQTEKDNKTVRIRLNKLSESLVPYLRENVVYCINNYVSKEKTFGCCSLYEKCSDAMKCLHANKLFSKACMYRANLENEKIFYGKNKNITETV